MSSYDLTPEPALPTDSNILWGATIDGISNKLPTRAAAGVPLDAGRAVDNLETAAGRVLAKIGSVDALPAPLVALAGHVIEYGAAAQFELQDFPEESVSNTSSAAVLEAKFVQLLNELVAGVEALGGEPNVQMRPIFTFDPPSMIRYKEF